MQSEKGLHKKWKMQIKKRHKLARGFKAKIIKQMGVKQGLSVL
jgi:hypothetical protein